MRKIILLYFAGIVFFFSGCKKDPLDITPDGRITLDQVFTNEKHTEAYLNTIYKSIPTYFWNYWHWSFMAAATDDIQDSDAGTSPYSLGPQWNVGSLTPSYDPFMRGQYPEVRYVMFWTGIRDANVFLENIDNANVPSPTNRSRFKAEATLLRAFYYWELIKQFGPLPTMNKPFDAAFDYTALKRPTFQEAVDFIVRDCDDAIANPDLPMRITTEGQRGRFSKALAYAIKSQALLYNASPLWNPTNDALKWKAAADASKAALEVLTSGGQYALASNYGDYFLTQTDLNTSPRDRETIYERPGKGDEWILSAVHSIPSKTGLFKAGNCPTQELVDSYDMQATGEPAITGYHDADHLQPVINTASGYDENNPYLGRDPRFYATVWHNGAKYDNVGGVIHTMETYLGGADGLLSPSPYNTHTGYYLRKYIDPKLQTYEVGSAQWKKYRLAELYLNYAEAENEINGPTSEAYEAINTIRRRVDMPDLPSGLSKDEMRERIHRERRVELVLEEHRFWDVRRWKTLAETQKVVTGMEIRQTAAGKINISNAGFEDGNQGWVVQGEATVQTDESYAGSAAIAMLNGGHIFQTVSVTPNTDYILSVWVKATAEWGLVGVRDHGYSEANALQSAGGGWVQKTVRFTTGPTAHTATIFSWWPGGAAGFVDDFELTQASGFSYNRFVVERRNAWQDKFLIFPIPLTEVSIIPDFSANQNPGW